jgi:hypothetical protein
LITFIVDRWHVNDISDILLWSVSWSPSWLGQPLRNRMSESQIVLLSSLWFLTGVLTLVRRCVLLAEQGHAEVKDVFQFSILFFCVVFFDHSLCVSISWRVQINYIFSDNVRILYTYCLNIFYYSKNMIRHSLLSHINMVCVCVCVVWMQVPMLIIYRHLYYCISFHSTRAHMKIILIISVLPS